MSKLTCTLIILEMKFDDISWALAIEIFMITRFINRYWLPWNLSEIRTAWSSYCDKSIDEIPSWSITMRLSPPVLIRFSARILNWCAAWKSSSWIHSRAKIRSIVILRNRSRPSSYGSFCWASAAGIISKPVVRIMLSASEIVISVHPNDMFDFLLYQVMTIQGAEIISLRFNQISHVRGHTYGRDDNWIVILSSKSLSRN